MPAGRPPKPTALKLLTGNPGKRPLKIEPMPARTDRVPTPPRALNKGAKREWRRVAEILHEVGILTLADLTALERYCRWYARAVEIDEKLDIEGAISTSSSEKGGTTEYLNPRFVASSMAWKHVAEAAAKLGLDPVSRVKLAVPKRDTKPVDPGFNAAPIQGKASGR